MRYTFPQYQESAAYLRQQTGGFSPKVAMILGSGLGYLGAVSYTHLDVYKRQRQNHSVQQRHVRIQQRRSFCIL